MAPTGAGDDFCAGADIKDPAYAASSPDPTAVAAAMRRINVASTCALPSLPEPDHRRRPGRVLRCRPRPRARLRRGARR
ncbi:MAG: hypothetical protein U5R31_17725 [Acidimicrobiia bacterium]|nr:hypothetical protein [Acidimicrobiia bacterium]